MNEGHFSDIFCTFIILRYLRTAKQGNNNKGKPNHFALPSINGKFSNQYRGPTWA